MEVWKYTLSTWASLGREERITICFFPLVVKCNDYCYNVIIWEMSTARIRYLPSISLFPRMQECSGRVFKHPSSFKYTLYSFESRREIGDWGEFSEGDWLYLHWKRAKQPTETPDTWHRFFLRFSFPTPRESRQKQNHECLWFMETQQQLQPIEGGRRLAWSSPRGTTKEENERVQILLSGSLRSGMHLSLRFGGMTANVVMLG